jgi:Alpha-2-macroglobulin family/Carboxypeptidase regulatory-like domain
VVSGPYYKTEVTSAGPDGIFDSDTLHSYDDVQEWTSSTRYFTAERDELERELAEHFKATKQFPQSEEELQPLLHAAKIEGGRLLDPWGRPYHFTFSKRSRYTDSVTVHAYYEYKNPQEKRVTEVTPVTQELAYITVVSYGPENKPEEAFQVAEFSRVVAERSSKDLEKKTPGTIQGPLPSGSGAITGVVKDASGAVIPDATVTATLNGRSTSAKTSLDGVYLLSSLPPGLYEVAFSARNFREIRYAGVPVQMGNTTALDATIPVSGATEVLDVTGAAPSIETASAEVTSLSATQLGTAAGEKALFTPRLRKYFPETLVWKPEVITDKHGQAHIDFTMADNITAWSMSVIASTESGQVGVAQKELRTFQPFFVEHDPPKVLTEGDQISLPIVLRNYSDKQQTLLTELKPEPWFAMLSPAQQQVTVPAAGDANAVFTFRVDKSIREGKQRVTAHNTETGDAVEREVRVHPDGRGSVFHHRTGTRRG